MTSSARVPTGGIGPRLPTYDRASGRPRLRALTAVEVARRAREGDTGDVRVLLVEDEVGLADAITRGLGAEGFEVEAVHDGLEGLARAREHRYAAVILDIMLPGMNGFQICRTLREEGVWTPILMLTAKDGEWDEAESLDTGADDFLSKPFSFVVLVARLRAILRRGAAPRPAVLTVGDLQLDPGDARGAPRRTARSSSRRVSSPSSSTSCADPARSCRRPRSSRRCGATTAMPTRTSSRCTSGYLRKKVDAPFGRRSLVTIRGAGYRVVDDRPAEREER